MAGDLNVVEKAVLETGAGASLAGGPGGSERSIHRYGRLNIIANLEAAGGAAAAAEALAGVAEGDLTEVERLGLAAFRLRESTDYRDSKQNRPKAGEDWDMPGCATVVPTPRSVRAEAAAPTSAYLEGSVAVGIVIVQGPGPLAFSDAEAAKVVAEVQNGLGWYATANPLAGISFTYDIKRSYSAVWRPGGRGVSWD